jgi:GNAT superfamily N-acetyltransferase
MEDLKFTVKPVTSATWPDLEALFEGKGGPSYCWCMAWRPLAARSSADNQARMQALHGRVREGIPIGLVGYVGAEPVAWCSVAPRETFRTLTAGQAAEDGVWSVVCFFIRRDHRGTGLSGQMLQAAADYARHNGGTVLEGYPVDRDSSSYRFMGFVPLYEGHGFKAAGRAGSRRHVMRLAL